MSKTKFNKTVIEIVAEYLEANGYGGLFHNGDCGCELNDLAPCCEALTDCEAGYRVVGCDAQCGQGCDWHICRSKEVDETSTPDTTIEGPPNVPLLP